MSLKTLTDHIHTYQRSRHRRNIFRCIDPLCTHYAQKEMLPGKASKCPCGNIFVLDEEALRRHQPLCPQKCSMRKEHVEARQMQDMVEKLFAPKDTGDEYVETK